MTHHHHLAQIRARFTGESTDDARCGVGRAGDHGLDTCSQAQLDLRALLLYFTFQPGAWNVWRAMFYTWNASPRYDEFVMVGPDAPDNLASSLLPPKDINGHGLPGLRLVPVPRDGMHECVHLPTGGRLRIGAEHGWLRIDRALTQYPLTPGERRALDDVPPMSQDTKRLFAAILARCNGRDRTDSWTLGQFAFARDLEWNDGHCASLRDFVLSGAENSWTLTWRGPLIPETVTKALTQPGTELPEVSVTVDEPRVASTVRFGTAVLRLRPHAGSLQPLPRPRYRRIRSI